MKEQITLQDLPSLKSEVGVMEFTLAKTICELLIDVEHEWWDANEDDFPIRTSLCHDVESTFESITFHDNNVKILLKYTDPYEDIMDDENIISLPTKIALSGDDSLIKNYFYNKAKSTLNIESRQELINLVRQLTSEDSVTLEKALQIIKDNSLTTLSSYNSIVECVDKYLEMHND